jgi:ectoine hydroxylase-related dioxygenase (phytanoyl-CoA dioxygenase family)
MFSDAAIAEAQIFFSEQGYLVLPGYFPAAVIDAVQTLVERVKMARPFDAVLDDLETGERTVLGLLTQEQAAHHRMKLYDLHLAVPPIRALALAPDLMPLLAALLGHAPALCHSLYLNKGSAQDPHVDSLYMTPRTPLHLIAIWVALEDSHPDSGPLEYIPGSHKLPQYRFSDGGFHGIDAEMPDWRAAMEGAAAQTRLEKRVFLAKKGDVFVWHAHLLHGGSPIRDPARTRKSYVFHYFSESDARAAGSILVPEAGAHWINRPPQPVSADTLARLPFVEAGYLARYADVAAAVANGDFPDGKTHYEIFGRNEGRLPY